ncbi:GtrA family protein [Actinoplanes sp. NPDC051494]|uniref:GtrA family protein n=1 Tax=Actinoplanes sp. NPDC051494 TaxID=3363907 RepID=UPI003799F670
MWRADAGRLVRYGLSGSASAVTHLGLALALHEGAGFTPVLASGIGFVASIVVSYVLQRNWVFRSRTTHVTGGAKFLAVTAVAWTVNTVVVWAGTAILHAPYRHVQVAALFLIPVFNFALNSRWTFISESIPQRQADREAGYRR